MRHTKHIVIALALLLPVAACQNKKKLDTYVNALRTAAETNDYKAFVAISHPELPIKFPQEKLAAVSKALAKLGVFKDRTMTKINVQFGGPSSGHYKLTYEKGVVKLEIAVLKGKIVKFNFSGDDFKKALIASTYGEFKIARFDFLDGKGGKKKGNNVYKLGQTVFFRMMVYGMKEEGGTLWGKVAAKVEADGEVIYQKPDFLDTKAPLKAGDPPVLTVNGHFKLPRVGTYKISFVVTDAHAGKSLNYRQVVALEQ